MTIALVDLLLSLISLVLAFAFSWSPNQMLWNFWLMSAGYTLMFLLAITARKWRVQWQRREQSWVMFVIFETFNFFFLLWFAICAHYFALPLLVSVVPLEWVGGKLTREVLLDHALLIFQISWYLLPLVVVRAVTEARFMHYDPTNQKIFDREFKRQFGTPVLKLFAVGFLCACLRAARMPIFWSYLLSSLWFLHWGTVTMLLQKLRRLSRR